VKPYALLPKPRVKLRGTIFGSFELYWSAPDSGSPQYYALSPMVVMGGGLFLMCEVPLYGPVQGYLAQ